MQQLTKQIEQWVVRTLCALSLLLVGFAHQVPALPAKQLSPAELAQYILPDGTLPTLCVTVIDGAGQEHGKVGHLTGCEACRISASVVLPVPADVVGAPIGFAFTVELPRRAEAIHRQLYPPNTGPRAPPADPILS
ncbi:MULTISPECIES: hypothetical protein [unclassified Rhizobium]|uniref:hypothetical protein n=1 Tax=unclassified Rhizobium TaxID=2613769 RepID=UPI00382EB86C